MNTLKKHLGLTGDVGEKLQADSTVFYKTLGTCDLCRAEEKLEKCYKCQRALFQDIRTFMIGAVVVDAWLDQHNGDSGTWYSKENIDLYLIIGRNQFSSVGYIEYHNRKVFAERKTNAVIIINR